MGGREGGWEGKQGTHIISLTFIKGLREGKGGGEGVVLMSSTHIF